jgi:hypothetical protein
MQTANAAMQARLQPGARFMWIDDEPGRVEDIRAKGLHIAPVGPHIPKKVPSGLIHDWLGVGFLPNVKIEDILDCTRLMTSTRTFTSQELSIQSLTVLTERKTSFLCGW